MKEKELLKYLEQMRASTGEAVKLLNPPSSYAKNFEALEDAIQIIKEHRKSTAKIRQLQRSLRAKQKRPIRAWNCHAVPPKHSA